MMLLCDDGVGRSLGRGSHGATSSIYRPGDVASRSRAGPIMPTWIVCRWCPTRNRFPRSSRSTPHPVAHAESSIARRVGNESNGCSTGYQTEGIVAPYGFGSVGAVVDRIGYGRHGVEVL
jgi:hypothetical protein